MAMSDAPKRPDEGESTLAGEPVSAWETVQSPVPQNSVNPPPPQSSQPQILPPPPAAGAGGYRPVYDGQTQSAAPGAGYGGTVYGGPPQGAPPVYGQPPYGQQGYPQNNNATDAVGLLATWWMMRRARRRLRLLLVLPLVLVVLFIVFVMHGCLSF